MVLYLGQATGSVRRGERRHIRAIGKSFGRNIEMIRKTSQEMIEMRYSTENHRTPIVEIIFLAIGVILLLILGVIASG